MFDKQLLLKDFLAPDDKLLFAKVLDRAQFSIKKKSVCFTDFFDPFRTSLFIKKLNSIKEISVLAFGGKDDSERKMIALFPSFLNICARDFPIKIIKIDKNIRADGVLVHRHCLGSILGLGIDRSKVGDIEIFEQTAIVYVHSDIAEYVILNLEKVSKVKVTSVIIDNIEDEYINQKQPLISKKTVASLRVDAVISAVFNLSRSKSKDFVSSERLFVNWLVVKNAGYLLKEGDVITLRGFGRVKFIKILGTTKKDRLLIEIEQNK